MKSFCILFTVAASLAFTTRAEAGFDITDVDGATIVSKPASVDAGVTESDLPIVFQEADSVTLVDPLAVDHLNDGDSVIASPSLTASTINSDLDPGAIAAGTTVDSYFFHFDSVGAPLFDTYVTVIEFATTVVGVQLFGESFPLLDGGAAYTGTLEAGDAVFGGSTTYATTSDRGLEEDGFVLEVSGNEVMIAGFTSGSAIDQMRIITLAVVPEPFSAAIWASIVGAMVISPRRFMD